MENELQNKPETLYSELGNWNSQERKFGEIFSPDALKDREFLKMKLENYDRLYHKYNGKPLTTDEKAMLTMLRYQRRKMEKSLYPGLLTRLLHRGSSLVKGLLARNREATALRRDNRQPVAYNPQPIPVPGNGQKQQQRQDATMRKMPVPKYGQHNSLRMKHRPGKHQRRGPSL